LLITVSIGVQLINVVGESDVRKGQLTPLAVAFPFYYKSMFQMRKGVRMVELRLPIVIFLTE
jgi:hypothetical protein